MKVWRNFAILTKANFNKNDVLLRCVSAVKDLFDIDRWQIGQPIVLGDIAYELSLVDGVASVVPPDEDNPDKHQIVIKNLFDLGFDRVGFVVEPNKISLLKNVVNSLCTQYGGQALFLVFEVKDKKKVTNELEKFLNFAESFGVGEIIIKDVEADNNDLNFEFCERILAEVEKREILIGYSGGLKYEYKNKQLFQLFSCIVLGGDITLIKSNTVLPGF